MSKRASVVKMMTTSQRATYTWLWGGESHQGRYEKAGGSGLTPLPVRVGVTIACLHIKRRENDIIPE